MSTERVGSPRIPDSASEARLLEIKRQGEVRGKVEGRGIRPAGAPFPKASPETGYYGIPLLKEPHGRRRFRSTFLLAESPVRPP